MTIMLRRLFPLLFVACYACAQVPHQHHPPSSSEYARVLEDPSRHAWQKPHEVVEALELKPSKKQLPVGPAPEMKLSDEEVIAELGRAGFHLERKLGLLPYQYFLIFRRDSGHR